MIRDRNKTMAEEIAKAKQESIAARDAEWVAVMGRGIQCIHCAADVLRASTYAAHPVLILISPLS